MSKPINTAQREARQDVYETITNQILAQIEANPGKWIRPWGKLGTSGLPTNIVTGKQYRGINLVTLWVLGDSNNYSSNIWGTYRQWVEKGCQVNKGEKSITVVFYKQWDGTETDEEGKSKKGAFMARAYHVFNRDQVSGDFVSEQPQELTTVERIEIAETYIANTKAIIRHNGDRAFYRPSADFIQLPIRSMFRDTASYAATALHEIGHWTGHESRCNRELANKYGSPDYAQEELTAELISAFILGKLGIADEPRPDHAQYLNSWIQALRNDKKYLFKAASSAQKACDYLDGLQNNSDLALAA